MSLAGKYKVLLAVFALVVVADQATKYLAVSRLTRAFEVAGLDSFGERLAGFYRLENLDNDPFEAGKSDLRRGVHVVIPRFWHHKYVENPGAAWGLLGGLDERWRIPFFHVVTLVAITFILLFYRKIEADQRLLGLSLSLVFAGAVGNYIDRLARNYVVDFIDWHWRGRPDMHWPTFNVADAAISVGVALMLLDSIWGGRKVAPTEASDEKPSEPQRSGPSETDGPAEMSRETESN